MGKKILKREVRFSWHLPKNNAREDTHFIRENITYEDGTSEPVSYFKENYTRPVYVTERSKRNHKDKKEYELKENLLMQKTTQSDINITTARMLERIELARSPDEIKNSPYVYGYDVPSTTILKLESLHRNNYSQSEYSVAAFDIETIPKTNIIQMATIVFKDRIYTAVRKGYCEKISNLNDRVTNAFNHHLPEHKDFKIEIAVHENEVALLKDIFRVANEWKPDFLAIWNMDFDISTILKRLKELRANPFDVICDQSIPKHLRVCKYIQGLQKKVKSNKKVYPIKPSAQWHTLMATTNFYVIDSMCVYRQLRPGKELPSYALDAVLDKHEIRKKLKFEPAEKYHKEKWHIFMQENYPVEYMVYNMYDCIAMLLLDKKIGDLRRSLPSQCEFTDFSGFNSSVKKTRDNFFKFCLEQGRVLGTAPKVDRDEEIDVKDEDLEDSDDDEDEQYDDDGNLIYDPNIHKVLGVSGWIQLLPQNRLIKDGLRCIEEFPNLVTNIRGAVYDQDSVSSYPTCGSVGNVSKETCVNELISIEGVSEEVFREQNLALLLGGVNSLEYGEVMFGLPSVMDIDDYLEDDEFMSNIIDNNSKDDEIISQIEEEMV